LKNDIKFN
jgi:hypothetical protein